MPAPPRRRWLRFSLSTLLATIVLLGLACAALTDTSDLTLKIVRSVTFVTLLVVGVSSVVFSGRGRAFFLAFAVAAWSNLVWEYLVAGFETDRPTLPTTFLIRYLWTLIRIEDPTWAGAPDVFSSPEPPYIPEWHLFAEVGLLIITLLLGLIAGAAAWFLKKGE